MEKILRLLEDKALSPNALFILYTISNNKALNNINDDEYIDAVNLLQERKFIKITNTKNLGFNLRLAGEELIKEINNINTSKEQVVKEVIKEVVKKPKDESKELTDEISNWIDDYRALFKGKKIGSMGDKNGCLSKMVRFFNEYPEHADKDKIFRATTKYIDAEGLNSNFKYLQQANYFIFKQTSNKEETSRLASHCDELGIEKEEISMTRSL